MASWRDLPLAKKCDQYCLRYAAPCSSGSMVVEVEDDEVVEVAKVEGEDVGVSRG